MIVQPAGDITCPLPPALCPLFDRLPERDPEPIQIANDDLAHAVDRVVRRLDDLDAGFEPLVEVIDVVDVDVALDFAAPGVRRLAALAEHDPALAEGEHRPVVLVRGHHGEAGDVDVPRGGGGDVGDVEHGEDFGHGALKPPPSPATPSDRR